MTPRELLILVSRSPERRRLLRSIVPDFLEDSVKVDSSVCLAETPRKYVQRMVMAKLDAYQGKGYILTAETVVAVGRRIFDYTSDADTARSRLKLLSGRRHRVYTALGLRLPCARVLSRIALTHVSFKRLEEREIQCFVDSQQWCNGLLYDYHSIAGCFIRQINGQPSTILGLPLFDTYQLLRGHGLL